MRLQGRVVIVTGGARNIGRVYATGLAQEGARVVVADVLDSSETVKEIEGSGGEALGLSVDVSEEDATLRMARATRERFGRIDALVNNAALYHDIIRKPFHELSRAEWDRLMAVNQTGPFLCCKAVFPTMRDQRYGRIINIASNTVYKGTEGFLHYVTSKAGVVGFTRALARECGPYGIHVNAVAPDYIPHARDLREDPERDPMIQRQRIVQRRQVPQDVVGTIVFLLSADADFITGQTILVNGGAILQ